MPEKNTAIPERLETTRRLAQRLAERTVRLMEVCGTHTMAISRLGLRSLLAKNVKLISGPGCPVCVTVAGYVDAAVGLAERPGFTVATFGDMLKVPGSRGSLADARARGARVKVLYSPMGALELAQANPADQVVFLGVGFETTTPAVAGAIHQARRRELDNFSVLTAAKTIPPALRALVSDTEVAVDGFICPGHVSVIIGSDAYRFVAEEFGRPCVVAGFAAGNILDSVNMLLTQLVEGRAEVEVEYTSVVSPEGNRKAQRLLAETFDVADAAWRGIGVIPASGLAIKDRLAQFDAQKRFGITIPEREPETGCRCGQVMRGVIEPEDCPLFARACKPESPVGPCMVSSEGVCAAHYRYDRIR